MQIHDDGVGTAGRRPAKPHIPDSIGNAKKKYGGQFCGVTGEKQGKSPKRGLSRNSSHKTRKTSQKSAAKNNTATTRRYIACICSTAHAAEGKPPVLITASAERHRCSGRCPQKTTVIIKTHCNTQGKRSRVRTAKEEGHESNKIAKVRAKRATIDTHVQAKTRGICRNAQFCQTLERKQKMRAAPYASPPKHNHETIANSQTGKKGWRKSAATQVNTCYKNRQPVSDVAKIGKYCGKHKKTEENRQKYGQMCANNRNKTQQSVKKKVKIAAQQREKRIKTTTGNTLSTAQFV